MTYLVHWMPLQTDVKVMRFENAAAASVAYAALPEARAGSILDGPADFADEISKTMLVRLYNALAKEVPPINTVSNRTAGMEKVWGVLTTKFNNLPITASKEPKVESVTEDQVTDNTAETPTDVPAADAPAAEEKRTRALKSETGAFKAVREGSSLATILRMMNGKNTFEKIAEKSDIPPGVFSVVEKVKHRIKHVLRVSHGIEHTVDEKGHIHAVFPGDVTLASAIKAAPVAGSGGGVDAEAKAKAKADKAEAAAKAKADKEAAAAKVAADKEAAKVAKAEAKAAKAKAKEDADAKAKADKDAAKVRENESDVMDAMVKSHDVPEGDVEIDLAAAE